jgi:hypothetical protein
VRKWSQAVRSCLSGRPSGALKQEPRSWLADTAVAAVLAVAWWADQISGNVATVQVGAETRQFMRVPNGQWISPGTGYAKLTQSGSRVAEGWQAYCRRQLLRCLLPTMVGGACTARPTPRSWRRKPLFIP